MDDDALAHAWESFATALHEVPERRAYERTLARVMQNSPLGGMGKLGDQGMAQLQQNAFYLPFDSRQYRGIQRGIFGFGITI